MKSRILLFSFFAVFVLACSKNNSPSLPGVTYNLYNYSSGSPQSAGTFTIQETSDKNAYLKIQLNKAFLSPGINLTANIVTADSTQTLVYANLQVVNGGSGSSVTNPVIASGTSRPVPYSALIGLSGYDVQVLNGANIQAKGPIE